MSITTMVDCNVGDGRWTVARELKPGMLEAVRDGWAPMRWCLFVEPGHVYAGREFELEAVLATEDVLKLGTYTANLKVFGEPGVIWEKSVEFHVPQPSAGTDAPLTVNVLRERVKLDVPPGAYEFAASLKDGGAPAGGRRKFFVSSAPAAVSNCAVTILGLGKETEQWLVSHGVTCRPFQSTGPNVREVILAGDLSKTNTGYDEWKDLLRRIARGSTVVFISPSSFKRGDDPTGWLPLEKKGSGYLFKDWVYHKECVAKSHPVFDGLPGKGVMNWEYYDQIIPHFVFDGQDTPDDVIAAWFTTGYQDGTLREKFKTGYGAGLLLAEYRFGRGRFFINTFRLLENLDINPAADRMLINIIRYVQNDAGKPLSPLQDDFKSRLEKLFCT